MHLRSTRRRRAPSTTTLRLPSGCLHVPPSTVLNIGSKYFASPHVPCQTSAEGPLAPLPRGFTREAFQHTPPKHLPTHSVPYRRFLSIRLMQRRSFEGQKLAAAERPWSINMCARPVTNLCALMNQEPQGHGQSLKRRAELQPTIACMHSYILSTGTGRESARTERTSSRV